MIGDNVTEYEKRHTIHVATQTKMVGCSPLIHTTLRTYIEREDRTYYWQH